VKGYNYDYGPEHNCKCTKTQVCLWPFLCRPVWNVIKLIRFVVIVVPVWCINEGFHVMELFLKNEMLGGRIVLIC
jgi:hypothetical protein